MNAAHQKQNDRRVSHLKSFIARFGHGAKNLAKQAQSRMKMLQKIQDEPCEVDFDDPYLKLDFPSATTLPPPCISVTNAAFGYEPGKTLYQNCNFGVDCESRVAIVGPNGAGKSTFLKLLTGEIDPTEGHVGRHAKLIVAKFTQHHIEMMDPEKNSVVHVRMRHVAQLKPRPKSERRVSSVSPLDSRAFSDARPDRGGRIHRRGAQVSRPLRPDGRPSAQPHRCALWRSEVAPCLC